MRYPGYICAWGSTNQWERTPGGPFVAVTYTSPDSDGLSSRSEFFCSTLDEAERIARAWWDVVKSLPGRDVL